MRTDPAVRRFEFPTGRRVMTDIIVAENGTLVDRLGSSGILEAAFDARVIDGGLVLNSTRVLVRLGPVTLRIPPRLAPAPVLGRLYEYSGSFRYSVDNGGETS